MSAAVTPQTEPDLEHPILSPEGNLGATMSRFGEWANPILMKELRRSLKSRQFLISFSLVLLTCWLISVAGTLTNANLIEFSPTSSLFFMSYYTIIAIVTMLVIPYSLHRSLTDEQDSKSFELLSITTLAPNQIVWGQLLAAMLQMFVYFSAVTPFMAFTSLLQGFDALRFGVLLIVLLFACVLVTMASVSISCLPSQHSGKGVLSVMVLAVLGGSFSLLMTVMGAVISGQIDLDQYFWIGLGLFAVYAISFFFLFQQIAASQLTFEADNRSSGIRIVVTAQLLVMAGSIFLLARLVSSFSNVITEMMILFLMTCSYLTVSALFFALESDHISRRVLRDMPGNLFVRLLTTPWQPGGSRGMMFYLVHLILISAIYYGLTLSYPGTTAKQYSITIASVLYSLILVCFGALFSRGIQALSPELKPVHARTMLTFVVIIIILIPHVILFFNGFYDQPGERFSYWLILNPFATISLMMAGTQTPYLIELLCVIAGLFLLANLPTMFLCIRQSWHSNKALKNSEGKGHVVKLS